MRSAINAHEFILASLLTSYPDEMFSVDVQLMLEEEQSMFSQELRRRITGIISDTGKIDDFRSEYLNLFDSGRGVAPLYETEYGRQRAFFKANELSAIAGFYQAFGFELGGEDTAREMADHLSVELEFYALLLMKQAHLEESGDGIGAAIVKSAREKFLRDHLGRFVSAILARPGVSESEIYADILRFCEKLIQSECAILGVVPEIANWVEGEQETSAEVSCGGTVGCLK